MDLLWAPSENSEVARYALGYVLLTGCRLCTGAKAHFVGSESCKGCHAKEYNGWKQTRMANVVRDPREHPEAVIGDTTCDREKENRRRKEQPEIATHEAGWI